MSSTKHICDSSSSEDETQSSSPTSSWTVQNWTNEIYGDSWSTSWGASWGASWGDHWNVIASNDTASGTAPATVGTCTAPPAAGTCTGCVTRITNLGDKRGCIECDEYWDMPDLILNANDDNDDNDSEKSYCEGCDLLDAGIGGENQMSHSCMGY